MALFYSALAALPRSPENQTLLPVSLFWFAFGKRKYHFLFFFKYIFELLWTPWIKEMSPSDITYRLFLYMNSNKQVWQCVVMRPLRLVGGWVLAIACDLLGFSQVKTQMLAFSTVRKCTKGVFILHWLKAHLQHAFDISVTQGYHTVHHSSCDGSLKGRLHYSLLLACFNIRENGLMASRPYH